MECFQDESFGGRPLTRWNVMFLPRGLKLEDLQFRCFRSFVRPRRKIFRLANMGLGSFEFFGVFLSLFDLAENGSLSGSRGEPYPDPPGLGRDRSPVFWRRLLRCSAAF